MRAFKKACPSGTSIGYVHRVRPSGTSTGYKFIFDISTISIFSPNNYLHTFKWCPRHTSATMLPSKNPKDSPHEGALRNKLPSFVLK